MTTIPASAIVRVEANVIDGGGSALVLNGLALTESTRVPIGVVQPFSSAADVADYFGPDAPETNAATIYFAGYQNSTQKPRRILFTQYNADDVAAYLRGGDISGLTLAELQAIPSGTITIVFNGVSKVSASISLAGATSFSNAATLILAGFTTPGFTVTYDSISGAFVFTSSTTGDASTSAFPTTSTLATNLLLTQATGAVLSQGADAVSTPSAFMTALVQETQNWATFFLMFDPDDPDENDIKMAFALWNAQQDNRWGFICWDTDSAPKVTVPSVTAMGQKLKAGDYSGTCLISAPTYEKAAFTSGAAASIDFDRTNGRITFAFKSQSGQVADVSNQTVAANLIQNGYNFYGVYATANDEFIWLYNGTVSGEFLWFDGYVNQIQLNNALQLALMSLLKNTPSIPYNNAGYGLIRAACQDPINAALNFGSIRIGVPLSEAQAAEVNNAAGTKIDDVITTQGYYLQILPATAQVRAARQSPQITLWYADGGAVQSIVLVSTAIL